MRKIHLLLALFCLAQAPAFGQSFTISTSPRKLTIASGNGTFKVHVSPVAGYAASVFLSASSATLPGITFSFSQSRINAPYTDEAVLTVTLTGPKIGGVHDVTIQGTNGGLVVTDVVQMEIPLKTAWVVYDKSTSDIPSNVIKTLALDLQGNAWIGTDVGLTMFDGNAWKKMDAAAGFPPAKSGHWDPRYGGVSSIVVDNSGAVWVAADRNVSKYDNGTWTDYGNGSGTILDVIMGMTIDSHGNVWVVTYRSGAAKFDGTNWTAINVGKESHASSMLCGITADRKGNIWMASFGTSGLIKFDGQFWTVYSEEELGFYSNQSNRLFVDPNDDLWITTGRSVVKIDATGPHSIHSANQDTTPAGAPPPSFPGNEPSLMAFGGNGTTWVSQEFIDVNAGNMQEGSTGGLAKFYSTGNDMYDISNSGLPDNRVSGLALGRGNSVWVATYGGGLAVLDGNQSGYTLPTSGIDESSSPTSSRLLGGIYPNPMNSHASTTFNLKDRGTVGVTLVNQLGQVVKGIYSGETSAGPHTVPFASDRLPAGIYFVKVEAGGSVDFKSVSIVK